MPLHHYYVRLFVFFLSSFRSFFLFGFGQKSINPTKVAVAVVTSRLHGWFDQNHTRAETTNATDTCMTFE